MCPGVAFQIKGVVESLEAEGARVALDVTVPFVVSIQQSLLIETRLADLALEFSVLLALHWRLHLFWLGTCGQLQSKGVLDPMAAVREFRGGVRMNPNLAIRGLKMVDISMFSIGYKKLNQKRKHNSILKLKYLQGLARPPCASPPTPFLVHCSSTFFVIQYFLSCIFFHKKVFHHKIFLFIFSYHLNKLITYRIIWIENQKILFCVMLSLFIF